MIGHWACSTKYPSFSPCSVCIKISAIHHGNWHKFRWGLQHVELRVARQNIWHHKKACSCWCWMFEVLIIWCCISSPSLSKKTTETQTDTCKIWNGQHLIWKHYYPLNSPIPLETSLGCLILSRLSFGSESEKVINEDCWGQQEKSAHCCCCCFRFPSLDTLAVFWT